MKDRVLQSLKRALRRSKAGTVLFHTLSNYRAGRRHGKGDIETASGTTHLGLSVEDSVAYITQVYQDYLTYAGIGPEDLSGKTVLEIGPGDNFGVAFLFLCDGASRVLALDRFYSSRDEAQQQQIYKALGDHLNPAARERYKSLVASRLGESGQTDGAFGYVYGVGIEEAEQVVGNEKFDFIVSRAVLEHVDSPRDALATMARLLAPGGKLIHKVDLRDHGMFTGSGLHPLEFLTISDRVYSAMTRKSGRPNRHMVDFYRSSLEALGMDFRIFVTHVAGQDGEILPHREELRPRVDYDDSDLERVQRIRPKLIDRFRRLSDEDLLTSGIFFVAG